MDKFVKQILDKMNIGIIVIDSDQKIILWNNWLERFTNISKDNAVSRNLSEICPKFVEVIFQNILNNAIINGQRRFCSGTLHKYFILPDLKNAEEKINRQNLIVEPLNNGDERYVLLQIHDVTGYYTQVLELRGLIKTIKNDYEEVKKTAKKNKKLAFHDPLTELPNRLSFMNKLEKSINDAKNSQELPAVLFLDLDGFKQINDTYGHNVGDELLKTAANILKNNLRSNDIVARFGGDEFVISALHTGDKKNIEFIAEKILKCFESPVKINDNQIKINSSIGISIYPKDGLSAQELIMNADNAMYKVKKTGKNNFKFF